MNDFKKDAEKLDRLMKNAITERDEVLERLSKRIFDLWDYTADIRLVMREYGIKYANAQIRDKSTAHGLLIGRKGDCLYAYDGSVVTEVSAADDTATGKEIRLTDYLRDANLTIVEYGLTFFNDLPEKAPVAITRRTARARELLAKL